MIGKTTDGASYGSPLCPRVYVHVFVGVFTQTLFPIRPGVTFNYSANGALVDACYFPDTKVGQICLYPPFLTGGFDCQSLDSMEYDYS